MHGKSRIGITLAWLGLLSLLAAACNLGPALFPQGSTPFPRVPLYHTPITPSPGAGTPVPAPAEGAASPQPAGLHEPVGKIVYTCQIYKDSKRNQICLIGADGSNPVRLTQADAVDHNFASMAPDGASVLYAANSTGKYQIYELAVGPGNQPAGDPVQRTDLPGDSYGAAVSPDGTRMVFTHEENDVRTIWISNRDGSDAHPLEPAFAGEGWDPVWSPDGLWVMFASPRTGLTQLYAIQPDGQNLRQLTNIGGIRGRSDWSPDGSTISTYVGESWNREIYLFNADGSNPRAITQGGNNLAPSFSPDGGWITFTSYRDRYRDDHGCEIYIMRLDGSDIRRLTDNDFCDWQPRWGR